MDTYRESFLEICNAEGKAPSWAIKQIFEEHSSDLEEYLTQVSDLTWDDGEAILEWIGY